MIVRQVANTLDLLEFFARTKKPASPSEVSAALGWTRSSTFNLLSTLEQRGFLYEPQRRGGFYPSTRWLSLMEDVAEADLLPEDLCHAADEIFRETQETVAIAAPAGLHAVLLYVVETSAAIRFSALPGFRIPLHASSVGRALLAQYSPRERASAERKIRYESYPVQVDTPMNPTELEATIRQEIAQGWHQSTGIGDDLSGIAMAVGAPKRPLALLVGGPASRIGKKVPMIVEAMQRALKPAA